MNKFIQTSLSFCLEVIEQANRTSATDENNAATMPTPNPAPYRIIDDEVKTNVSRIHGSAVSLKCSRNVVISSLFFESGLR